MFTRNALPALFVVVLSGLMLSACESQVSPLGGVTESGNPVSVDDATSAVSADSAEGTDIAATAETAASADTADTAIQGGRLDLAALPMTVHKSPSCGCCGAWVGYMGEEGFSVTSIDTDEMDTVKAKLGIEAPKLQSCHTATIGGYVIEGHVPAADVRRLLAERPDGVVGLTAPGMPMMSPGMGSREPKDYDVLAFDEDGTTRIWSSY